MSAGSQASNVQNPSNPSSGGHDIAPRGRTGAPNHSQLVYRRHPETGQPVEGHLTWGIIPSYVRTRPDFRPIHARAETITEQRMFRDAYCSRRCIVPMDSFFQKDARGKRFGISLLDGGPFGVAGIWENWRDPDTSKWERTFAIITVPASKLVAEVHDRMPAILDKENFAHWLGTEEDPRDLLKPYPAEQLSVAPVVTSRRS